MSSPPPDSYNFFGFTPNLAFNASFLAIFGALTVLHTVLTVLQRRRDPLDGHIVTHGSWWRRHHVLGWGWITVVGGIGEIIGWAGRLWGHFDDTSLNAYLINQVCLAISPVFFSASCYVAFGLLIQILGPQYSRLKPRLYVIVFVVIDVLSLILQGIGGGMSGAAAGGDSGANLQTGRDIYLAGISFQLFNMLVFAYLVVEYLVRLHRAGGLFHHVAKPNGGSAAGQATPTTITIDTVRERRAIKLIVLGLAITTTMIVMRNFYRDVELGEGFDGFLATRENYFLLDAIPMVIAMIALAISHPIFTFDRLAPISAINAAAGGAHADQEKNLTSSSSSSSATSPLANTNAAAVPMSRQDSSATTAVAGHNGPGSGFAEKGVAPNGAVSGQSVV